MKVFIALCLCGLSVALPAKPHCKPLTVRMVFSSSPIQECSLIAQRKRRPSRYLLPCQKCSRGIHRLYLFPTHVRVWQMFAVIWAVR